MAEKVPFFKLFAQLPLERELQYLLQGAEVSDVVIVQAEEALHMKLYTKEELTARAKSRLAAVIADAFSLKRVEIENTFTEKAVLASAGEKDAPKKEQQAEVLMGKPIRGKAVSMKDLNPKMGQVTVEGKVFQQEFYETRRPGVFCLVFSMTDYQSSVTVRRYLQGSDAKKMEGEIFLENADRNALRTVLQALHNQTADEQHLKDNLLSLL